MNELKLTGKQMFLGVEIPVLEGGFGDNSKCMLAKTVSEIHKVNVGNINQRINDNRARFKDGIDIIDLKSGYTANVLPDLGLNRCQINASKNIYILSERGYAKLIKIMDSDLAWDIHDKLIDEYFTMRQVINSNEQLKAMALLKAIESNGEQSAIAIKQYVDLRVNEEKKPLLQTITQKQTVIDSVIKDDGLFAVSDVGRMIKNYCKDMGANKIFEYLREQKIFFDEPNTSRHNTPYSKYSKAFDVKMIDRNDRTHYKTYFTGKGLKWFMDRLVKQELMSVEQKQKAEQQFK